HASPPPLGFSPLRAASPPAAPSTISLPLSPARETVPSHVLDPALPCTVVSDRAQVAAMEVRGVVVSVICMEERGKVRMTDRWEGAARLELQRSHHGGVEPSITTHRPQFRIWSLSYDSTSRLCSLELTVLLCWTGRRGPACCRYKPSRWTASAKSFAGI
uniref:Uncharacterized protein n=1 Tax=Aegilops tauschii subsp. strangulata TaxID=200361 RepID=A0A453CZP8_AEGTS